MVITKPTHSRKSGGRKQTKTDLRTVLRNLREQKGWSRAELARRAHMHASTISWAENGRLVLGRSQLRKIARALGVRLTTLIGPSE